ncbi:hypothetical protein DESC_90040 [Desulfosarcina cetonica]|nr:hypothetical protein DESC_90040 [Desulfosarcina cetonica]
MFLNPSNVDVQTFTLDPHHSSSPVAMQYRPSVLRTPTLQFITDGPQEGFAFGDVGVPFDTLGRETVDDPQDTPSLGAFGDDHLHRVGRRTKNAAHLGYGFDRVEDVDREHVAHENDEAMACGQGEGIILGQRDQFVVRPGMAYQADVGCLAESESEFCPRHGVDDGLEQILDGFDEMGVPENEVEAFGIIDRDGFQFHGLSSFFSK